MGYYNYRVTGSSLTLPYSLYERTHSALPLFIWEPFRPEQPPLHHADMQQFEKEMGIGLEDMRRRFPLGRVEDLVKLWWGFVTPVSGLALVGLLWTPRQQLPSVKAASLIALAIFASNFLSSWTASRYVAPATVAVFMLSVIGFAALNDRFVGSKSGLVLLLILGTAAASTTVGAVRYFHQQQGETTWWQSKRAIRSQLLARPGGDLVFVRYGPRHNPHNSWVYNGANLGAQPIIWAREIDPSSDLELRSHYGERQAWIVLADDRPARLIPWTASAQLDQ